MKRGRDDGAQSGPSAKRPLAAGAGQQKLTTSDALSYLRNVKNQFSDNKEVYDTFLEIMKEFKAQRIDTTGVIGRVKKLFKGHRELILGFNTFLPKGYEIELARISDDEEEEEPKEGYPPPKQPVEFDQAINYVNKIKTRFANDDRVYKAFLEILNMYRKGQKTIHAVYNEVAVLFKSHNDLLEEFTYFLPDAQAAKESHQRKAAAAGYRAAGRGGPSGRGAAAGSPGDMRSMHKRKAAKKAEEGFKAGYGFDDAADLRRPNPMARELLYFERVKARVRASPTAYPDMLKCIHLYNQEIISRGELIGLVNDIIGKHQDLMAGFHEFLVKCETMDVDMTATLNRAGGAGAPAGREALRQKGVPKDKLLSKPLSEIVAHETERVTPSYVKIPVGYPKLNCTGRTELGTEVLNDLFVNVITGSEDYSFKLMRKNQYEEALFRCEDDRYEFEMCIETTASALKLLRPIAEQLAAMSPDDKAAFRLDERMLMPYHVKAIESLYGDAGPVLMELLRRNPGVAVPVVVGRMEQKDAEWRKVKEDMTKIWRKIYEQNYHKSLDHRSFYFKQAEKKQLLPKTMVQEVREAAERRRADEEPAGVVRCMSLAHRYEVTSTPDLTFDYGERLVFEDCWSILRTAVEESLAPGPREQVLQLYLSMVEPLFCVPPRKEELAKVQSKGGVRRFKPSRGGPEPDTKSGEDTDREGDRETSRGAKHASKAATPEPGGAGGADASGAEDTGMDEGGREAMDLGSTRDDEGEEDADEQPGRSYCGCKPLAPFMGPVVSGAPPGTSRLLLANETMYIFLRFHRHLYERLWVARKCAHQQALQHNQQQQWATTSVATPVPDAGDAGDAATAAAASGEADSIHGTFMAKTQQLLTGELEISLYEDQVRALLGTNSYELFTLDKLIHKLLNHMRTMVQDAQTMRLWELFRYEHSRASGVNAVAYHINCHAVLEETCYRFDFRESAGEMTVALVEPDKSEALAAAEGFVTDYIRGYLAAGTPPRLPDDSKPLFLRRNFGGARRGGVTAGARRPQRAAAAAGGSSAGGGASAAEEEEDVAAALRQFALCNGLECKISCSTSKVSYVLDTEDILCRLKRRTSGPSPAYRKARQARFSKWLEETIARLKADKDAAEALMGGMTGQENQAPAAAQQAATPPPQAQAPPPPQAQQ